MAVDPRLKRMLQKSLGTMAKKYGQMVGRHVINTGEHHDTGTFGGAMSSGTAFRIADQGATDVSMEIGGSQMWKAYTAEHGRKPGKPPPYDALVGWVIRWRQKRGLDTQGGTKTGRYIDQPFVVRRSIRNLALRIAGRGTKAKHVFTRVLKKNKRTLMQTFEKEMRKQLG